VAFFSADGANPDRVEHLHATGGSDGAISLLWEDATNGGDRDFDDAVLSVKGLKRIDTPRFVYQAEARDLDGDAVTYRLLQGPAGATISATTGLLSWNNPTVGSHTFRLVAAVHAGRRSASADCQRRQLHHVGRQGHERQRAGQ
jgi:hypothetical protein